VLDEQRAAGQKPDAVETGSDPIDFDAAQNHPIVRASLDDNAVSSRYQHASDYALTRDRQCLGDRHSTEPCGIEAVNLARRRRFGNRAGECLAWRGSAARISI